ncbi:MAG: hypothetical protein H7239_13490 [Flavobacterium sp.]|nr:hypothetical protein [Flavobacterium sp.]
MEDFEFTISQQINTTSEGFRHVVILGAGASKASCIDKPEKSGSLIPLMNDLPKIIDLKNELNDLSDELLNENFEKIFSTLFEIEPNSERLKSIETKIYDYFSSLELPDVPTIYDYLVLSLRNKDLIATFNWDPFLWQAYHRNLNFTKNLPKLVFLHGNVAIGTCEKSKTFGPNGTRSLKSGDLFTPTKLLYPVANKNYNSDNFIKSQWNLLSKFLEKPARVTIFGYSAPVSDVEAISIMKKAWGNPEIDQVLAQFEIIDIQNKSKLEKSWKNFIFSHHYEISKDFFKSSIVRFPRRTGEVYCATYLEAKFYEENYPPKFKTMDEMWNWYKPFIEKEKQ